MENKKLLSITKYDFFVTVVISVIGAGGFSYGRELAEIVGKNGQYIACICGFITFLAAMLIYYSCKVNNFKSFTLMTEESFGKVIGKIVALEFAIGVTVFLAIQVRAYTEVIKMKLLSKTPAELIIIIMIICGTYLVRGGLESLIKFNELALWIMLIPIIVIVIFAILKINVHNLMPFVDFQRIALFKGVKNSTYAFNGIGVIYLLLPYLSQKDEFKKIAGTAFGFITFFYIVIYLIVIGFFGVEETGELLWPFIAMISNVEIPGNFVENWEGIIMVVYMILNFTAFVNLYFVSASVLKDIFRFDDVKLSIIFVVPFIYVVSIIPQNILDVNASLTYFFPYFYLANYLVLPLLFLSSNYLKRRREGV